MNLNDTRVMNDTNDYAHRQTAAIVHNKMTIQILELNMKFI